MMRRQILRLKWAIALAGWLLFVLLGFAPVAQASNLDPYVMRFLDIATPVALPLDHTGAVKEFSAVDLSAGKRLFEDNCLTCHVGGTTLPNPLVPLSLETLKGATPPRDAIAPLVSFIRQPMTYDGTEEELFCRQVSDAWMSTTEVENLAAFVLRAAEKAPGWGSQDF